MRMGSQGAFRSAALCIGLFGAALAATAFAPAGVAAGPGFRVFPKGLPVWDGPGATSRVIAAGLSRSPVPAPGTNFRISAGASNALRQENPNDFGDYNGLSFVGGVLRAGWGDNSAELGGNPDAPELEIATAGVLVAPNGAISVGPTVNATRSPGYQSETSVAVNPTDPLNAVTGNNVAGADELGISVTTDGGTTWTYRTIATGKDGLPAACCDPTMAYDAFGTLWYGYLTADIRVCILKSSDGGQTFEVAALLGKANETDQPTVVTGSGGAEAPQALWVTYRARDGIVLAGAPVFGKGDLGAFRLQKAPGSGDGNFGDVAVGPDGEVAVVYQTPSSGEGPTNLFYHLDRDGLGSAIGLSLPIYLMRVSGHHRIREERDRAGCDSSDG